MTHQCQYCKKTFAKETTLSVHQCERKRRHLNQNDAPVRLGFQAYLKFFELHHGSAKTKTYSDFAESPYYLAFTKFGNYCISIRAVNPARFIEWLLKHNKKLDRWASDTLYSEYLLDYLRVESVQDALTRAIEYSINWRDETGNPDCDCLRYGNTNKIMYAISTGRISPWIIYNCESGMKFLSDLSSEQIQLIWPYINTDFWQKKFQEYPEDTAYVKDILKQARW